MGERAYGLHQILEKVCDPQTKNPNLGEHLSHPLELQRRKLRPERDWDLLRSSSQLVKWNPGLRERERALDSGPGPQAQPCLLTNGPNRTSLCALYLHWPEAGEGALVPGPQHGLEGWAFSSAPKGKRSGSCWAQGWGAGLRRKGSGRAGGVLVPGKPSATD